MNLSQRACLAFFLCMPIQAWAQQPPAPAAAAQPDAASPSLSAALGSPPASAPKTAEGRIHLDVVVTDKSGKPVTGLGINDFTLLDNNQPAKILSFKAVDGAVQKADPPVEVILVVDEVNQTHKTASVRQDVAKLLSRNGGHLAQPVSLYVLARSGLDRLSQPSVDGNALAASLSRVDDSTHTTNPSEPAVTLSFIDRFKSSLQAFAAIAKNESAMPEKKLLIWFGQGWPTFDSDRGPIASKSLRESFFDSIVQLSTRLREARISVYSVSPEEGLSSIYYQRFLSGVKTAQDANAADLDLKVLIIQSGGHFVGPDNDLAAQIDSSIRDASAFYTLSFDPPPAARADEFHDLKIKIDNPRLTARTDTGYYNQPQAAPVPASDRTASDVDANPVAAPAGKPVTVEQLELTLNQAHGQPDAETARQLAGLVLTERLSSAKLAALKAGLPGAKAQQALVALADTSAFLNPPSAEIPANVAPDLTEQRRIMAQAIDYLSNTLPKLPNFFATRTTAHYEEALPKSEKGGAESIGGGPLHLTDTFNATVLYRNGHEVVQPDKAKGKKPVPQAERLVITGTFGPILSVVIEDAPGGHLKWSRWEQGAQGPLGVFSFAVPRKLSHYTWNDANSLFAVGIDELQQPTAYHGEIAVDPATGVILRLVMEADREPDSPRIRADIMVEYGPVEIGGKTYFCPVRSVSLSRESSSSPFTSNTKPILGPAMTMLNDVSFGDYHMFRSEVKLLNPDDPLPDAK
jgi:VWFA-related protein